jgi:hypothetical protein
LRLERNILRRWPNAAAVTFSSTAAWQGTGAASRGVMCTTEEVTLGGGVKARGEMSKSFVAWQRHCEMIDNRP